MVDVIRKTVPRMPVVEIMCQTLLDKNRKVFENHPPWIFRETIC